MSFADRLERPEIVIDWSTRGFLRPGSPIAAEEFAVAGHSLFGGAFTWPVMVAKRSALEHNLAALARFAAEHGLAFAPHGKTTMSPELFQAQLDAGAWGISAATPAQVLVCRKFGVPRVLLANEIFDVAALRWLAAEIEHFEFLCYVDSAEGVRVLDEAAGAVPFRVLIELGHEGGRTGCRGTAALLEVAEAVREARGVELAGVACYEGTQPGAGGVRAFLREFREAAEAVAPYVTGQMIVSAGGSAWFDLVAEELSPLTGESGLNALAILRSGAYIAHDDGFYREHTPYNRIAPGAGGLVGGLVGGQVGGMAGLRPALEVWAQVLSVPEPGLAFVGMGKRDVPYDLDLPVARAVRHGPSGETMPINGPNRDGPNRDGPKVVKVWDQHAQVVWNAQGAAGAGPQPRDLGPRDLGPGDLGPGDLVAFGISHPCTAFDKWRVIPVVDDDYVVVDLIATFF
ncbi:alanine racemase [Sphaerimonospora cavernae]|uniref:Alanine racemase n=1 Tax=Sphaerimonospora cavernae TaxID=1740611 RepID=A0ABV6U6W2_9ACTN